MLPYLSKLSKNETLICAKIKEYKLHLLNYWLTV